MIRIVTDTTAVLPRDYVDQHHIVVVPQVIRFGNESYLEGVEISEAEFLRRLVSSPVLPGTAAPSPGRFDESFRQGGRGPGAPGDRGDPLLPESRHSHHRYAHDWRLPGRSGEDGRRLA